MKRQSIEPKLLPKLCVFVRVPRQYLLRRLFRPVQLTQKETTRLKGKLGQVKKAITYLRHLQSIISRILEKQ